MAHNYIINAGVYLSPNIYFGIRKTSSSDFLYSMEDNTYEFVSDYEDKELSVYYFKQNHLL